MQLLLALQAIARDGDHTLLVGNEVRQDNRTLRKKIEIGEFGLGPSPHFWLRFILGLGLGCRITRSCKVISLAGPLAAGLRLTDGPRIEQQAGAPQRITGKFACLASIEDIPILITDHAALNITCFQRSQTAPQWLRIVDPRQMVKRRIRWLITSRKNVNAGKTRHLTKLNANLLLPHL